MWKHYFIGKLCQYSPGQTILGDVKHILSEGGLKDYMYGQQFIECI